MAKTGRALALLLTLGLAASACFAQTGLKSAPNRVDITPRLVTSGQPSVEDLRQLRAQGFDADIYLAPLDVSDAVHDEAEIVRRQGLMFINIPIRFGTPTEQDYQAFAAAMSKLSERKVLVHCQVNFRASSMVFLYRVIAGKEDPALAYESVAKVWSPEAPWKRFIEQELQRNGVDFEPY